MYLRRSTSPSWNPLFVSQEPEQIIRRGMKVRLDDNRRGIHLCSFWLRFHWYRRGRARVRGNTLFVREESEQIIRREMKVCAEENSGVVHICRFWVRFHCYRGGGLRYTVPSWGRVRGCRSTSSAWISADGQIS